MWSLRTNDELPLWRPDASDTAAILAFGTRRGGVSAPPFDSLNVGRSTADRAEAVEENRRRMLAACGLEFARLATAGQVHGATATSVTGSGHVPACDALLTRTPGLVLAVTTADCMSLLFTATGTVAAAHSGWRGTAAGMPLVTLEAVCRSSGVDSHHVTVHLGPCIRGCCYIVGSEVAAAFPPEAVRRNGDDLHLDLPTAARLQLQSAGVEAIFDTGACTACEPHWYFSHRRSRGACGRHWALVALRDGKISGEL